MKKIVFLTFVLFLIVGCQNKKEPKDAYTKIKSPPTNLINGIKSYSSEKDVLRELAVKAKDVEVIFDDKLKADDPRPRFDNKLIEIKYSHLGFDGKLKLIFFNNRLWATTFYPRQYDKYKKKLKSQLKVRFNLKNEARVVPYTQIYVLPGDKSVMWSDIRLNNENKFWIARYS